MTALFGGLAGREAIAYTTYPCGSGNYTWPASQYWPRISTSDFPTTSWWHTALHNALGVWDGTGGPDPSAPNPGSNLDVVHGLHTTIGDALDDGVSAVVLEYCSGGGTIAHARQDFDPVTCQITEVDIGFYERIRSDCAVVVDWRSGVYEQETVYLSTGPHFVEPVLAHELGHAIGLNHQGGYPDTMNSPVPMGGHVGGELAVLEDARVGARVLYPAQTTGTDLGFSPFRWDLDENRSVRVPKITLTHPLEKSAANPASDFTREYCIHNLGTSTVTVGSRYYWSFDSTIDTGDTVLGTWYSTVAPNVPYCPNRTLTVPEVPSGTYWVGAIVDFNGSFTEMSETNNEAVDLSSFTVP